MWCYQLQYHLILCGYGNLTYLGPKTISMQEVTQLPVEVTGPKKSKKYGALKP